MQAVFIAAVHKLMADSVPAANHLSAGSLCPAAENRSFVGILVFGF